MKDFYLFLRTLAEKGGLRANREAVTELRGGPISTEQLKEMFSVWRMQNHTAGQQIMKGL